MKYNGTANGKLSFIIATNEILNAFVPSDRYSLTRTTDKLTLTIQSKICAYGIVKVFLGLDY